MLSRRQLVSVDPQRIKFNSLNPRKHRGTEYLRLSESIKKLGIVQLPTVRVLDGNFFEAIDGEGRISVAQEEHFEAIWVVSIGFVEEHEALLMLQAANTTRSFNFLAECKGLANLHGQGNTLDQLAEQFSTHESKIAHMVAIGYFPNDLFARIQDDIALSEEHAANWSYNLLYSMLPLRELLPGQSAAGRNWSSLENVYDYHEVSKAVEEVISGRITTSEKMHTYVVGRRYEIYQERFDQDLQRRLQEELAQTQKDLEAVNEQKLRDIELRTQERYQDQISILQSQLNDLSKRHTQIVKQVARRPEIIEKREQELQEEIQRAERERQELQQKRQQWEEDARKKQMKLQEDARQAQEQREKELKQRLGIELAAQREEQEQRLKKTEEDVRSFYAQKDQEKQIKAENTVRGLLSNTIKSLTDAQQLIDHVVSPGMIQGVQQLGGAQHSSLLWAIRSLNEALDRAEKKLTYGSIVTHVASGGTNGHTEISPEELF
jgi:hypothetical protein